MYVLLWWDWLGRQLFVVAQLPVTRTTDPDFETSTLELRLSDHVEGSGPLLSIKLDVNDTVNASVPRMPRSSSPASTYPIRVLILHIIVPDRLLVIAALSLISLRLTPCLGLRFTDSSSSVSFLHSENSLAVQNSRARLERCTSA